MNLLLLSELLGAAFGALFGACLGSFANVVILRGHAGQSFGGRSQCPECDRRLGAFELIPILSWFGLRGKCAGCRSPISVQYPLVESAAAAIGLVSAFVANPFIEGGTARFFFFLILGVGLLIPFVSDIRWQEIPLEPLWALSVFALVMNLAGWGVVSDATFVARLVSLGIAVVFALIWFGLQAWLSRERWLGWGDVWLGILMALVVGTPAIFVAVYLGYLLGGAVAIVGLLTGKFKRGAKLAFGPFLVAGLLIALWFGPQIIQAIKQWYG